MRRIVRAPSAAGPWGGAAGPPTRLHVSRTRSFARPLYEELSAPMRVRLHQRGGRGLLEETPRRRSRASFLGELAHHFSYQAARGRGRAEKANQLRHRGRPSAPSHALAYEEGGRTTTSARSRRSTSSCRATTRATARLLLGLGEATHACR